METQHRQKIRTVLFDDQKSAEAGYSAALKRGYKPDNITVIMSEDSRKKYYGATFVKTETGDKSMEGLAVGGALGGILLGTLAAVVSLSSAIVIPGVGLVIAGPLAAALVGVGAGSIAGGIVGALIGAGIPEEHAKIYENGIKKGGVVVSVNSSDHDNELLEDWKKSNGRDIY